MNYGIDHTNKVTKDLFKAKNTFFDKVNYEYSQIIESYKKKFEISYKLLINAVRYRSDQVNNEVKLDN